ncbi:MAG: prolyl oligopeptidase family serine peptidase [Porphyromonas sp.]|nr:prolyl oligopeptidase family serine peptidase [Porphyromonas sp.]
MKRKTFLAAMLCSLFLGSGALLAQETKAKQETGQPKISYAQRMHYSGPVNISRPVLSDSTNLAGRSYDLQTMLHYAPRVNVANDTRTLISPKNGEKPLFTIPVKRVQDPNTLQYHIFNFNLLAETYTKGTLSVECNAPFEVLVDNASKMRGQGAKAVNDSIKPQTSKITLLPRTHMVTVKVTLSSKDSLENIDLRAGFSPEREDRVVEVRSDVKHHPDPNFMIYGRSLAGSQISPSGDYIILYFRPSAASKAGEQAFLFHKGKKIAEFDGVASRARWMPKTDKLYYDETTEKGRTLYAYDPKAMKREVIHTNIPEKGGYFMSPAETSLIYHVSEDGPKYDKNLDRLVSPGDRLPGFRSRVFISIFDLKSGVFAPITFGNKSTHVQDMAQDDSKLIFSITTPMLTKRPFRTTNFYEVDLKTMKVDTLFVNETEIAQLKYSSLPNKLVAVGSADAFGGVGRLLPKGVIANSYDSQLFLYDRVTKTAKSLSKSLDRSISSVSIPSNRAEVYFSAEVGDRKLLFVSDLKSGSITRLSKKEDYVKNFSVSALSGNVTYIGQSATTSDRFYTIDSKKRKETLLYDLDAEKGKDLIRSTMIDWDYKTLDGTEIQGRFYLPPNFNPNKKYPMLVYYYAGTAPVNRIFEGSYSLAMYASLGYVVYSMNPSGSTGYGQEFAARHVNAWGDRTAAEIISAVKAFCKSHPFVNEKKIGCMGASYGGFMTQYLQTQTDIFAAAVSHAGISALSSYWGEGYWGVGYSAVASADSYPWNNPDLYTKHSPLFLADKINTPLLLLHGTKDTNVPDGESVQMYQALKILGKDVEYIRVYGEDHGIINPEKRLAWTSAIMAFFAKHLQDDPTWWNDLFPANNL